MVQIHPTAVVDNKAQLGEGVTIGPYAVIRGDVVVGDGTHIDTGVVLEEGTRLGKNCRVGPYTVLGGPPQDLKYSGEKTTVEIGDGTTIREYVTINRGTDYHWKTVVGKNCFIMTYAHIAHDCIIGDNVIIANAVNMGGHVEIDSFASVGGLTAIHQFVKIGTHAFVGGGLRINKDVPPYIRVMGEPARYGGTNYIGLSRRGFSNETILEIKRAYRIIYQSHYTLKEAVEVIQQTLQPLPEIQEILKFVERSNRGFVRG